MKAFLSILILILLSLQSCTDSGVEQDNVLKTLEGNWLVSNMTFDGTPNPAIDGFYIRIQKDSISSNIFEELGLPLNNAYTLDNSVIQITGKELSLNLISLEGDSMQINLDPLIDGERFKIDVSLNKE